MTSEQRLAKALDIALQVIKRQESQLGFLTASFVALRDSVASGKPPLPFDDAQAQVREEMRGSRYIPDEVGPLLEEQIGIVRALARKPPKKKPAKKRRG